MNRRLDCSNELGSSRVENASRLLYFRGHPHRLGFEGHGFIRRGKWLPVCQTGLLDVVHGRFDEVRELVQGVVDTANERFNAVEQVKAFALLPKELDHDEGELTATQKVKRSAVTGMFADLVDELYEGAR